MESEEIARTDVGEEEEGVREESWGNRTVVAHLDKGRENNFDISSTQEYFYIIDILHSWNLT